ARAAARWTHACFRQRSRILPRSAHRDTWRSLAFRRGLDVQRWRQRGPIGGAFARRRVCSGAVASVVDRRPQACPLPDPPPQAGEGALGWTRPQAGEGALGWTRPQAGEGALGWTRPQAGDRALGWTRPQARRYGSATKRD